MSDTSPTFNWFIVQAVVGQEKPVAKAIRERIVRNELESQFGEVLVPTEEVVEMKNGQKRRSERKFFPGYVLVSIDNSSGNITSEAWHAVRDTPKVLGFLGGTRERPIPISEAEANTILARLNTDEVSKPVLAIPYKKGDSVRINEGPFNDFNGIVEEVDTDKGILKVSLLIFGRPTPVDIGYGSVDKTE